MLIETGRRAKAASKILARASTENKNAALLALAEALSAARAEVLTANARDVAEGRANGLSDALIDRLLLNDGRVDGLCADLRHLVELNDPVGQHFDETTLPNGIQLRKQRVPLGVLGVIYEARPNVTMDVAGLALKTGNAAILRGGKETIHSNRTLVKIVQQTLGACGLPADGARPAQAARICRHHHPARRRQTARLLPRKQPDTGHHRRNRHLSPVRG
jgi:glutamate-5-semialdehyde dehydrogenase